MKRLATVGLLASLAHCRAPSEPSFEATTHEQPCDCPSTVSSAPAPADQATKIWPYGRSEDILFMVEARAYSLISEGPPARLKEPVWVVALAEGEMRIERAKSEPWLSGPFDGDCGPVSIKPYTLRAGRRTTLVPTDSARQNVEACERVGLDAPAFFCESNTAGVVGIRPSGPGLADLDFCSSSIRMAVGTSLEQLTVIPADERVMADLLGDPADLPPGLGPSPELWRDCHLGLVNCEPDRIAVECTVGNSAWARERAAGKWTRVVDSGQMCSRVERRPRITVVAN